ncbi:MAG: tRNA pseudouridine(55) synthase TruB [Lachnospiraceae bacterium]|nr:tRNA pseudouridine(55) synthase TruB [Lachnospiraceae bacterium]
MTDNKKETGINGVINVYKEQDFTSHDVVAKMRGILKIKKIGHTGTLDPKAEGVLPICIGNATRICDILTDRSKEYLAVMKLGIRTDTLDVFGQITAMADADKVLSQSEELIRETVKGFQGKIVQIPPMYSAIKVGGKKLYELAREGKEIERKGREVFIDSIEIKRIDLPYVEIYVKCSKGTYIRTLCDDIGERLGVFAAMSSLIRTRVGNFCADDARRIDEIEKLRDEGRLNEIIVPADRIFKEYKSIVRDSVMKGHEEIYEKLLYNGNPISLSLFREEEITSERFRMYDLSGNFKGIYSLDQKKERLTPYKMFL